MPELPQHSCAWYLSPMCSTEPHEYSPRKYKFTSEGNTTAGESHVTTGDGWVRKTEGMPSKVKGPSKRSVTDTLAQDILREIKSLRDIQVNQGKQLAKLKAENVHLKRCHADLAASYESLDQNCETWVSQIHGSLLTAGGIGRRAFDMAIKVSKDIKQLGENLDYHVNDCESYLGDICDDVREREANLHEIIKVVGDTARSDTRNLRSDLLDGHKEFISQNNEDIIRPSDEISLLPASSEGVRGICSRGVRAPLVRHENVREQFIEGVFMTPSNTSEVDNLEVGETVGEELLVGVKPAVVSAPISGAQTAVHSNAKYGVFLTTSQRTEQVDEGGGGSEVRLETERVMESAEERPPTAENGGRCGGRGINERDGCDGSERGMMVSVDDYQDRGCNRSLPTRPQRSLLAKVKTNVKANAINSDDESSTDNVSLPVTASNTLPTVCQDSTPLAIRLGIPPSEASQCRGLSNCYRIDTSGEYAVLPVGPGSSGTSGSTETACYQFGREARVGICARRRVAVRLSV